MEEILEKIQDFNKGVISNLLINLCKTIDKFNDQKVNNFVFTPQYHIDMGLTVAGYSYKCFAAKLRQLDVENDPIETMNHLKPVFSDLLKHNVQKLLMMKQQYKIYAVS